MSNILTMEELNLLVEDIKSQNDIYVAAPQFKNHYIKVSKEEILSTIDLMLEEIKEDPFEGMPQRIIWLIDENYDIWIEHHKEM